MADCKYTGKPIPNQQEFFNLLCDSLKSFNLPEIQLGIETLGYGHVCFIVRANNVVGEEHPKANFEATVADIKHMALKRLFVKSIQVVFKHADGALTISNSYRPCQPRTD